MHKSIQEYSQTIFFCSSTFFLLAINKYGRFLSRRVIISTWGYNYFFYIKIWQLFGEIKYQNKPCTSIKIQVGIFAAGGTVLCAIMFRQHLSHCVVRNKGSALVGKINFLSRCSCTVLTVLIRFVVSMFIKGIHSLSCSRYWSGLSKKGLSISSISGNFCKNHPK